MAGVSFSGLASGLDTGSLIDQLVTLERQRANALLTRQNELTTKKSIVSSLSSSLASLGTLAKGLDLDAEVQARKATTSDTRVGVATSSTAAPGTYTLRVQQLAQAQSTVSRALTSSAAGALGDGGVAITVAGVTKSITWTAADSLDTIATRINDASAGVAASVLYDGTAYRLVTVASNTGTAAAPTFVDSGDGLDLSNVANRKVTATDAMLDLNGIAITRPKNVISDAIAGTTLTLTAPTGATDPDTKIVISQDTDAITTKLKDFVAAYNAVNGALHVQLDYTGTQKSGNSLFGDSTLRQLQSQLAFAASSDYGGFNTGMVGITRDKTGAMTLDTSKLTAALAADPQAVSKLFVTGGFATGMATLTENYTKATSGILATKSQSFTDRGKVLQTQIDRINTGADELKTRLERQFSQLETVMSRLRNQSSQLSAILG